VAGRLVGVEHVVPLAAPAERADVPAVLLDIAGRAAQHGGGLDYRVTASVERDDPELVRRQDLVEPRRSVRRS